MNEDVRAALIKGRFKACLHGGGGPQIGVVTCGGSPHLSCKRNKIKMRDFMDRRFTRPKRFTSPTWGPPPHVNRPLDNLTHEIASKRILTALLSKKSETLSSQFFSEWSSRSQTRIDTSKIHDCERNSSPIIFIGNQMV